MKHLLRLFGLAATMAAASASADEPAVTSVTLSADRPNTALFVKQRGDTYVATTADIAKTDAYKPLCVAPCTVEAPIRGTYMIAGGQTVPSAPFQLPSGPSADLQVNTGSRAWKSFGAELASTGFIETVAGAVLLIAGYVTRPESFDPKYANEPNYLAHDRDIAARERLVGFVAGGAGLVSMVVGVTLMVTTNTHVLTRDAQPIARGPSLTPSGLVF